MLPGVRSETGEAASRTVGFGNSMLHLPGEVMLWTWKYVFAAIATRVCLSAGLCLILHSHPKNPLPHFKVLIKVSCSFRLMFLRTPGAETHPIGSVADPETSPPLRMLVSSADATAAMEDELFILVIAQDLAHDKADSSRYFGDISAATPV